MDEAFNVAVEVISPEKAKKYLAQNTSNRSLRRSLVSRYAKDMKSGNWKLTHQGLAFNAHGVLLDGQHRLAAVVESGLSVEMLVTRGVESGTQLVMDDHAKRSASDALTLDHGYRITALQVAVVRAAVELNGPAFISVRQTKTELSGLIKQFDDPLEFIKEFLVNKTAGIGSAAVWGAIALSWFYVKDLYRLHDFCKILTGQEMALAEEDRAAQLLREWLLRTPMKYGPQRLEAFKKTQRAVYAFMKRQPIERLYSTSFYYEWPLKNNFR
jgi:hypothetical protein